jgi:hypothetical protein
VSDLVSQLREEYRLKVFENRVLKRTFGSKRDEVMELWSILYAARYCVVGRMRSADEIWL